MSAGELHFERARQLHDVLREMNCAPELTVADLLRLTAQSLEVERMQRGIAAAALGCGIERVVEDLEPMHGWFGLSYANYLVLERSLIQSMPAEWQRRLLECLDDLHERFDGVERAAGFQVRAVDVSGRFMRDPIPHYNRGRTRVAPAREV